MECSEEGCSRPVKARGFCGTHYWKKRTNGELDKLPNSALNQEKRNAETYTCTACHGQFERRPSEVVRSMGNGFYCSAECWYRRNSSLQCKAEGCALPPRGAGYCKKHYTRFRRYGDPLVIKHEANGSPNIKRYRKKRLGDRITQEHTHVAEQILGRRLSPGENLHHRNGKKLENVPSNLILFPSMSAHRQYENRYREYLERCIADGFLVWAGEAPVFEFDEGVLLSDLVDAGSPVDVRDLWSNSSETQQATARRGS